MKPLVTQKSVKMLLERFERGIDAQNIRITVKSATKIEVQLSLQDTHREYNWIDVVFEIDGVSDARLLEENQLAHIDMSEGFSLIVTSCVTGFCIGNYTNSSNFRDSCLFIVGESLKYNELPFSEV